MWCRSLLSFKTPTIWSDGLRENEKELDTKWVSSISNLWDKSKEWKDTGVDNRIEAGILDLLWPQDSVLSFNWQFGWSVWLSMSTLILNSSHLLQFSIQCCPSKLTIWFAFGNWRKREVTWQTTSEFMEVVWDVVCEQWILWIFAGRSGHCCSCGYNPNVH